MSPTRGAAARAAAEQAKADELDKSIVAGTVKSGTLAVCLKCKCEDPDNGIVDTSKKGVCWLCEACYFEVESGRVSDNSGVCERIASMVVGDISSRVNGLVDKIADRLVNCGVVEGGKLESSFADVVSRKKPAKIVIRDGGEEFLDRASEALKETPISFLKKEKDGSVTIALPDQTTLTSAEECLATIMPENAQLTKSVRHPKITVRDFPLPSDISGRDELNNAIRESVKMKNPELRAMIERGDKFDVVYVGKSGDRMRASVGVRVSCEIRDLLTASGRLFVGNSSCKVEDRYYIPQCYKCQRFGHKSNVCEQADPACMFCAESHNTRDCPDRSRVCCVNCKRGRDPQFRGRACSHNAGSLNCPVYLLKLKNSKN